MYICCALPGFGGSDGQCTQLPLPTTPAVIRHIRHQERGPTYIVRRVPNQL